VPIVLDASVVGCWCFHDEQDGRADAALDLMEFENERAIVPAHWWFEVRNVVLQGERRGRVSEAQATRFLGRLDKLAIDHDALPDQVAVLLLARRHRLTFYDAAYLELARREGLALATLDEELAGAARRENVRLIAGS
jgi:predicted nucleic acid-binding protein